MESWLYVSIYEQIDTHSRVLQFYFSSMYVYLANEIYVYG